MAEERGLGEALRFAYPLYQAPKVVPYSQGEKTLPLAYSPNQDPKVVP